MAASAVAGGIFNAFAFAGASWIMSHVDHSNYQAEQHRHDIAVEKLQKEQDLWQRREVELRDKMEKAKLEEKEANEDIKEADDALDYYYKLTHQYNLHLQKEPKLDYKPNDEFQKYIDGVKMASVAGGVFFLSKYVF